MPYTHARLNQNPNRIHGFEPLRVDGQLPEDLAGTLVRTGPGLPERFGKRVRHSFEADGLMSAVRFEAGEAMGALQPVRGPGFLEEERVGRMLSGSSAGFIDRVRAFMGGRSKATGNTAMWCWGDELYALMEGDLPLRIDPRTLDTLAKCDFGGVVPGTFSAHPHRVAALETSFNFGCRLGPKMEIDFFALPDRGGARRLCKVSLPYSTMVHDFAATESHLLLLVCPAKLRLMRALFGVGALDSWFAWTPDLGTRAIVVPLDDPSSPRMFDVDPFFYFHCANAFQDGRDVVMDYARYENLDVLAEIGSESDDAERPSFHRGRLDVDTGSWRSEPLGEVWLEFPQVHPRVSGARHSVTFGVTESSERGHAGVVRFGDGSDAWMPTAGEQASEPVLVPRGTEEDDVWVLTLVHDEPQDRSYVAVLDGQRLPEGPVARVWFDQTVPLTFHGTFHAASANRA